MLMESGNRVEAALAAASEPRYIDTAAGLEEMVKQASQGAILGVDTEFVRERTFRAQLGLVQLSDGHTAWLVDPVAITDLQPLCELLTESSVLKVFHSVSEDFDVLRHTLGIIPRPVLDTQVGCAMIGQPLQTSYHSAVKWLTGREIDKDQTRSNWLKRPLTPAQLHYAATDVVFLPMLAETVESRLRPLDRWGWLVQDAEESARAAETDLAPELAYLRIGGAGSLADDQLRVLKSIAAWRERTAKERDLARGFVAKDASLLNITKALPSTAEQLSDLEVMHPKALKRHASGLLHAVAEGRQSSQAIQRPFVLDKADKRLSERLRKVVGKTAAALDVDPALLASRRVLEAAIAEIRQSGQLPERLRGWRYAVIGKQIEQVLRESETVHS